MTGMKHTRPILSALILAALTFAGPSQAAEGTVPRAVVELYTSQGCNSCPPADRVLYELNQEDHDLLVLSYHVDYWNYLGWTDPFSDARYSDRQRDYANRMRERYVYTPQIIINGDNVVRATAKSQIASTSASVDPLLALADIQVNVIDTTQPATGTVSLHNGNVASRHQNTQIWLVGFDREHQRDVLSGENAGKRLVHANVVREMVSLGAWDGTTKQIPFAMTAACDGGVAILVQDGRGGPIIAASMIRF
ncbi:DUF1223 domain-containing protein [Thalassospira sp.]|uniref:DUF1223 domain-containing protein n=1 Tax=Thalassospira sp. TaxID=1912094 RepID=UPI0032F007A0